MVLHGRRKCSRRDGWLPVLLVLCSALLDRSDGLNVTAQYPKDGKSSITWNNLAIDLSTQMVYAGGVNGLFQFDENLTLLNSQSTGPVYDNPSCYNDFGKNPCRNADNVSTSTSSSTENYNQVLVVDAKHGQLVTCGSIFQGTCQTRSLRNISNSTDYRGQFSQYVIVASRSYPSVAFVGPGPFGDDVLYVGTAYTGTSATEWILAKYLAGVSSRNLTGYGAFLVTEVDDRNPYGTRATLTMDAAAKYKIIYVAGFSLKGFSYFLTRQPEPFNTLPPVSNEITSKLVQVCQYDKYFDSYVEMRITCRSGSADYNLVQAAAFIRPGNALAGKLGLSTDDYVLLGAFATSNQTNFGTALCLYSLQDIRNMFTQNIRRCYNSSAYFVGPQFTSPSRQCSVYQATINESYCGSMFPILTRSFSRNSPLVGTLSLESSQPLLVLPGTNVTAVNAATVEDHTVAFVGTADGSLLKVLLDSANGSVYENSRVGMSGVNQDLLLDINKTHLYLMTSETIFQIPVSECQQFSSCDQCLAARDPYCGWCTVQKSCRRRSECPNNQLSSRWLSFYSESVCPSIDASPADCDISRDMNVTLTINPLPELAGDEHYICIFGSVASTSQPVVTGSQLVCSVPGNRPAIMSSDNIVINLSVRISSYSEEFIRTPFTFYDCGLHDGCSSCAGAQWGCQWCIFSDRCQNRTMSCLYDSLVDDITSCPSLLPGSTEILIPSGIARTISLTASNLPMPQSNEKGYFCEISSPGQTKLSIPAKRLSSSTVNCSSYVYRSAELQPFSASLRLVWGDGGYAIEGSYNVTVYNCSAMAEADCNRCLSLQFGSVAKYGCRWCSNVCQPNVSSCVSPGRTDEAICPSVVVSSMVPVAGPTEGGTLVTVYGSNLGYRFDKVTVQIGSDNCAGVENDYVISEKYVCKTRPVSSAGPRDFRVTVSNVTISLSFTFTNPKVFDVRPASGPRAGGTPITLSGVSLDSGSNFSVFIGQQGCSIDSARSNSSQIVCVTPGSNESTADLPIILNIDDSHKILNQQFTFTENPSIRTTVPSGSFKTGGCSVVVSVTNLNSIVNIGLQLDNGNNIIPVDVIFRNSSLFQFRSPSINTTVTSTAIYQLLMKLDGISSQLPFSVYPDPVVEPFAQGSRQYGGDTLQLNGLNLTTPCMNNYQSEVSVFVGSQTCNISSLTDTNLYCKPPDKAPDGATLARVTVKVGAVLQFDIGDLVYQTDQTSFIWPIVVGVIGGILVVIIILLILVFCMKSSENERQYRKLQAQMDALESGVRNECKQAFSDLQTDVCDFTSDINQIGIPFWDYKMYAFKVMFPMVTTHQVLFINNHNDRRYGEFNEKMHRFNQLLGSKYFLMTFIHTMERQPQSFGMADRSKVASLLSVVLIDKMEYATEIIKILLNELILKSIEKKAQKLMLRRAETVVEKLLSNWLSLSMYSYLKTKAGRSLFMLYKAIKHQTEKGPIDAVTAEARYSLSEDRLLRENIEPRVLNVTVYDADNKGQPPVLCKMLDCDTITQAKEKALDAIYMNMPFSKRPSRNSFDLKWNAGQPNYLPLNDEDVTTKRENGWKRINTMSHYHVSDGSVFQLQKNDQNRTVHQVHGMLELESGTLLSTIRLEEGTKVWHLVKHEDAVNNVKQKVISEIFLTRLLQTKMSLEVYVNDLFETILKVDGSLPPTVKYLYDFLDNAAKEHGIYDAEVVHAWKSNSLPLRFWVNLIKNPEFVFDINKTPVVDFCLSVIAQTFMDSFSTQEHKLGKDSPSAKLLFAKDIPKYRERVSQFYQGVKESPAVTDQAMANTMTDLSHTYGAEFNQEGALRELYDYALRFSNELSVALENDPSARKLRLADHFEQLELIEENMSSA